MTVADALATIKEDSALLADWAEEPTAISNVDADNCRARIVAAVESVEAEITRLEQENTQLLSNIKDEAVQTILAKEYGSEQFRRAEAAEAEIARLEEQHLTDVVLIAGLKARAEKAERYGEQDAAEVARLRDGLRQLRERAEREPLATDISDYGDEWCAGFLQGQANALDEARALLDEEKQ